LLWLCFIGVVVVVLVVLVVLVVVVVVVVGCSHWPFFLNNNKIRNDQLMLPHIWYQVPGTWYLVACTNCYKVLVPGTLPA